MTPQQIIHRLYELGHFHNPETQRGVRKDELSGLTLSDEPVRAAIASFQAFMQQDLDTFSDLHHHRAAEPDGLIGPATEDLFEFPRCGYPDYPVPDGTLSMGREEANWPSACRGKLKFGRSFRTLPGSTEALTHGVWWATCNNWTWALSDLDMTPAEVGNSSVNIYAALESLGGSTLAWSYLAQNNCSARLAQRYNTRVNWANQAFAATVASHEVGHAIGLPHNNDRAALMYPSIHAQSQARAGYPNQTDLNQCRSVGYTISSNGTTPPPRDKLYLPRPWDTPDPPPDPDGPRREGEFYIHGVQELRRRDNHQVVARFISVPHHQV